MSFFSATLLGTCAGQRVANVMWHRSATPWIDIQEFLGVREAYFSAVKASIWDSRSPLHVGGMGMKEFWPNTYTLESIRVDVYGNDFVPVTSDPFIYSVGEVAEGSETTNGPAPCAIVRANLEPVLGPGFGLPTRGYWAFGPLADNSVDSTGHLTDLFRGRLQDVADRLAENLVTVFPPAIFFPIRVRVTRVLGVITLITWKDVSSALVRTRASFRRSRLPEA